MGKMKADAVIKKQRTAMQEALAKAPEMKGRLLKNMDTGVTFAWTPHLSLQKNMEVVSIEEQQQIHVQELEDAEARKELDTLPVRGPQANVVDKKVSDEDNPKVVNIENMDEEELRAYASSINVNLGNTKDVGKMIEKIQSCQ